MRLKKRLIVYAAAIMVIFSAFANADTKMQSYAADFAKGADVSMLKQLEDNGAKFYDANGKQGDCMAILKSYGFNWIRLRTWVNPVDEKGSPIGGGNNDKATTVALASRAKKLGMKLLLDFHYSDFWADPSTQTKPKAWKDLTGESLENALYAYTLDVMKSLKEANALPDMVQVGNELNGGMVWPDGKTWRQGDEEIGGFDGFAGLLNAGIKAVKEINSSAKIMIHLADGGKNELYNWVFDALTERKVEYDVIGLSYYPYLHGTLEELQSNMDKISNKYNKDVIIAEFAYGYTLKAGDDKGDIFVAGSEVDGGAKATSKGQETAIRKVLNALTKVPDNRGKGFFYWEPDWIIAKNSGWKTGEGNNWENQALFDFKGKALPSLEAFKVDPAAPLPPAKITAINISEISAYIGGKTEMPEYINAVMSDDSIQKKNVAWDNIPAEKLKTAGIFTINGTVEGSDKKAQLMVNVSAVRNYLRDSSFEMNNIWEKSPWRLDDPKWVLRMEGETANVHSGKRSVTYWKDSDFTFDISQMVSGLENGIYKLKVWAMGEAGKKEVYLYADNGKERQKTKIADTKWPEWHQFEVSNINVTDGRVTIGVSASCKAKDWGKLDEFELIRVK